MTDSDDKQSNLLILALLSLPVGAATGLVGALFRLTLDQADRLRTLGIAWASAPLSNLLFGKAFSATGGLLAVFGAWLPSWFIAFPVVLVVAPVARRIVGTLVKA